MNTQIFSTNPASRCVIPGLMALTLVAATSPAMAEEAPDKPFTISGSAAIVSDYRFRGVSMTDKHMAAQAGISATHESGFYAGVWGSNLSGWGTFGGSNMELDIYGGYAREFSGIKVDVGLTWYMYPGGADKTDFAEPYVKVSTRYGPASMLVGVAYAPRQEALGNYSATPFSFGQKQDNLYVWTDGSVGIPGAPLTLKAHLGYSKGNSGLGPNGTSVAPTGSYWDWSLGAEAPVGPLTLGVSYIDTDISSAKSAYLLPNFASSKDGSSIAGSTAVFTASIAF